MGRKRLKSLNKTKQILPKSQKEELELVILQPSKLSALKDVITLEIKAPSEELLDSFQHVRGNQPFKIRYSDLRFCKALTYEATTSRCQADYYRLSTETPYYQFINTMTIQNIYTWLPPLKASTDVSEIIETKC